MTEYVARQRRAMRRPLHRGGAPTERVARKRRAMRRPTHRGGALPKGAMRRPSSPRTAVFLMLRIKKTAVRLSQRRTASNYIRNVMQNDDPAVYSEKLSSADHTCAFNLPFH